MFIYRIILEPALPLDIWSYRDAPNIGKDDAFLIWESFPFEEPEVFEEEPEFGPPPHIVFGSLRSSMLLMLSYSGKGHFDLTLCESQKNYWLKENIDRSDVRRIMDIFWDSDESPKKIKKEFNKKRGGLWGWLFGRR